MLSGLLALPVARFRGQGTTAPHLAVELLRPRLADQRSCGRGAVDAHAVPAVLAGEPVRGGGALHLAPRVSGDFGHLRHLLVFRRLSQPGTQ